MSVELEIHRIDLAYEPLRVADAGREARLLAAIGRDGLQQPLLVVAREERFVLIDGYRRLAALRKLGRDIVPAVVLPFGEAEALAYAHRVEANRRRSALEEGWLLRELIEAFGLRQQDLGKLLQQSQSWVSRRLGLVRQLPEAVQTAVREGRIGAHAAEKYLVPLARAMREHAERLVRNLGDLRPSDRQLERLYGAWRSGDAQTRERIVDHPGLFLEAVEPDVTKLPPEDPASAVVQAIEGITGSCGRARKVTRESGLHRLDRVGREAVSRAFEESTLAFGGVRRLLAEEGLDARQRDEDGGAAPLEGGAQRAGDREGAGDLAGSGR
jgi:ParB/RepB/Spo0J family partition protein